MFLIHLMIMGYPKIDSAVNTMKEGQIGAFAGDDEHIVICVTDRESIPLPPLKELSKQIRESVLVQKRQKALADWIATVKNKAKIQIDEKELRRIAHE
ncbi:MAG: hypothetical protein NTY86_00730 [Deltaproteobacteria bacterium]|nr:hypothetical protein [Deltaproteobacteria bacterium]